jgi:hypothetical protein
VNRKNLSYSKIGAIVRPSSLISAHTIVFYIYHQFYIFNLEAMNIISTYIYGYTYIYYIYRKMFLLVVKTSIYIFCSCRGIILKVLYASPEECVFFRVSSTIFYF